MVVTVVVIACLAIVLVGGVGTYMLVFRGRAPVTLPGDRPGRAVRNRDRPRAGKHARSLASSGACPLRGRGGDRGASADAGACPPSGAAPPAGPEPAPAPVLERPRFRERLGKARSLLASQLAGLRGRGRLDPQAWEELEEALILADVGVETVQALLDGLKEAARRDGLTSPEQVLAALRNELVRRLEGERELHFADDATTVWLFVGVNGVGKTTTIGKLALRQEAEGKRVVMAAARYLQGRGG